MDAGVDLLPLRVCNVCNTSDSVTIEHIRSALARGLPQFLPGHALKDKPLVILASGPSGREHLNRLFESQLEFDLMALNGAYNVALEEGAVPKYYAMLDAREVNVNFLTDPRKETHFYIRSEEHTSELQSHVNLVCRLLLEKKKTQ